VSLLTRPEYLLGVSASVVWALVVVAQLRPELLAGLVDLGLYPLYSVAAVLGWLAGNVFVVRLRSPDSRRHRRRLLLVYLLGPPAFVYLLRVAAPLATQTAAPLVPLYAFAVYGVFFLVPVSFRGMQRPPRRPNVGG